MAVVPVCHQMPYRGQTMPRSSTFEFHVMQEGFKSSSWVTNNFSWKKTGFLPASDVTARMKLKRRIYLSREGECGKNTECFCTKNEAPEFDSVKKHQKSLESYLEKLQSQDKQVPSDSVSDITKLDEISNQLQAMKELGSLERYLGLLKADGTSQECMPSTSGRNTSNVSEESVIGEFGSGRMMRKKGFAGRRYMKTGIYPRKSASSPLYDEKESANLYLIGILVSINIAVFLFEIASPIKSSDYNLYSLPLMYGAKVNDLIMVGEWWRLVTPMFLHSGLLHIALSSWVLLSFGPGVCRGYGSFTFLLIYILGGVSGNFTSFLHTSEPTVGGSGPVFAIIGAWLIYQFQNKDVTEKEVSETMFHKAIIATALSFVLANFGPIDNWTNLGAVISGILYGLFTCPVVQIDDAASDNTIQEGMKEEITLIRQSSNPCKSLFIFTLFLSLLCSSLLFLTESPLDSLELEGLVQIVE